MKKQKFSLTDIPAYNRFCDPGMNDDNMPYKWQSWGLVIRHLRDFIGLDQDIFGRLLQGYTRGQISRFEKEESEPPIDFWRKMMFTFGLNINWALTGEGLPYIIEYQNCKERSRLNDWINLIFEKKTFLNELKGY
jgi:hypothetical protein